MDNKEMKEILLWLEGRSEDLYNKIKIEEGNDNQRIYDKWQIDILRMILL